MIVFSYQAALQTPLLFALHTTGQVSGLSPMSDLAKLFDISFEEETGKIEISYEEDIVVKTLTQPLYNGRVGLCETILVIWSLGAV